MACPHWPVPARFPQSPDRSEQCRRRPNWRPTGSARPRWHRCSTVDGEPLQLPVLMKPNRLTLGREERFAHVLGSANLDRLVQGVHRAQVQPAVGPVHEMCSLRRQGKHMATSTGAPGGDAFGRGEREAHDSAGVGDDGRSPGDGDSDREDDEGSGGDEQWEHTCQIEDAERAPEWTASVSNAPSSTRRTAPISGIRSRIGFRRHRRSV